MRTHQLKIFMTFIVLAVILVSTIACNQSDQGSQKQTVEVPNTPILTAAFMGDRKTVQQHVDAKSDLDQKDEYGSTSLHIASTFGRPGIAEILIKGGANLNITNADGSTALHTATFLGRTEIVKMLLDHGADAQVRNNYGSTALESIQVPFEEVEMIYDQFSKDLGPFGLKLDYDEIKEARPVIASMLLKHDA